MSKQYIALATIAVIMILAIVVNPDFVSQPTISLDSVEIDEYQGEKLSSINDFRENSIKGKQNVDINTYHLEVSGLVVKPKNYTYDQVKNFTNYQKVVKLDCVEGWSVNILWEGVLVKDILNDVQPLPQANTIIFYATDGYSTSFPLEYVQKNQILMAYKMNNATIPPERGFPFQLVAESKWGYKWIKWINKIEISDNASYQGYWESRGYSNPGNLNEKFLK